MGATPMMGARRYRSVRLADDFCIALEAGLPKM
jgi:hypothetical protein